MAAPFRIPKKTQPADPADSLQMQSPLSRTHDGIGVKETWGQSDGARSERARPGNWLTSRAESDSRSMLRDAVKARLGLGNPVKGNSSISTAYRRPGQISELYPANQRASHPERNSWNSHSGSFSASHRAPKSSPTLSPPCFSMGRRPKRASDSLLLSPDENQKHFSGPGKRTSGSEPNDSVLSGKSSPLQPDQSSEEDSRPFSLKETKWRTAKSRINGPEVENTEREKRRSSEALQNGSSKAPLSASPASASNSDCVSDEECGPLSPTRTSWNRHDPAHSLNTLSSSPASVPRMRHDRLSAPSRTEKRTDFRSLPSGTSSQSSPSVSNVAERMRHVRRLSLNRTSWLAAGRDPNNAEADWGKEWERRRQKWETFRQRPAHPRRPKPTASEPIVLSSEEEEEEGQENEGDDERKTSERSSREKTQGPQHTPGEHTQAGAGERGSLASHHLPSVMELSFVCLHAGMVSGKANGNIVITDDGINLPLKDPESDGGDRVSVSLVASQIQGYGVWDGGLVQGGSLLRDWEGPAPSLLFLWVTEAQAKLLHTELSVIQPVAQPGWPCPFLLVVLSEQLGDLQATLLASILSVESYLLGSSPDLSSPLGWADGLALLHSCPAPLDTHLLALLGDSQEKPRQTRSSLRKSSSQQGMPSRLIQYPSAPCKGRITVTTEDLACLEEGEFLNDVIIDFYLKYLLLERAETVVAERCHIFSSFFYKQLSRQSAAAEDEDPSVLSRERRHQRVKTWTRHVDIFNKDYLFVPVNQSAHWYLVVICFPGLEEVRYEKWQIPAMAEGSGVKRKLQSKADGPPVEPKRPNGTFRSDLDFHASSGDEIGGKPSLASRSHKPPGCTQQGWLKETVCKRPCILVMDSLKLSYHLNVCKLLRDYLHVEWEVRRGTPRLFTSDNMRSTNCKVPLQDNSSDCGLYLLQYVESFLLNPVVHFDLPLQLEHWFPRQQVWRKRKEIKSLVMQMHKSQLNSKDASR